MGSDEAARSDLRHLDLLHEQEYRDRHIVNAFLEYDHRLKGSLGAPGIFHYMPVGNEAAVRSCFAGPKSSVSNMYHRVREIRGKEGGKQIFAMDFQNDGEFVGGCIAGGRRLHAHQCKRRCGAVCVYSLFRCKYSRGISFRCAASAALYGIPGRSAV